VQRPTSATVFAWILGGLEILWLPCAAVGTLGSGATDDLFSQIMRQNLPLRIWMIGPLPLQAVSSVLLIVWQLLGCGM
jgi:hypothetical protein